MSDIKLFQIASGSAFELPGASLQIERSLQDLFEANLETLLGVRFLAREFSTGPVHGGRIDTLGIDEDGSPVIIEYKRSIQENVINQGLYYIDWLMDHRGDFEMLAQRKLGSEAIHKVDWTGPRLLCIAGEFTRYDVHAVNQIARNIELIRYRLFGDDLLMVELIHNPRVARAGYPASGKPVQTHPKQGEATSASSANSDPYQSQRISYRVKQAKGELRALFDAVHQFLESLGDDVQVKEQKYYIAFKRIKNFACLEIYPQNKVIHVFLKINPESLSLEDGFTRDVRNIGHFGTGELQVTLRTMDDFRKAQALFQQSYENS